jgi:hypothetical protein
MARRYSIEKNTKVLNTANCLRWQCQKQERLPPPPNLRQAPPSFFAGSKRGSSTSSELH